MRSVAFFNNKGGVGKTTLLCNVAACIALNHRKNVCVVDADPQCNATQYFFDDETVEKIYENDESFTIFKVIEPLSLGDGYTDTVCPRKAVKFGVDVIVGDPRLALTEDLLARDWSDARSGEVRGIRTSLVFSQLLDKLSSYDYVLFDVSPSLARISHATL